jgi:hypothetical protein
MVMQPQPESNDSHQVEVRSISCLLGHYSFIMDIVDRVTFQGWRHGNLLRPGDPGNLERGPAG